MDRASQDWDAWAHRYGAWPHQLEAFRRALNQNSILNMPTGTGKTLVACMLLDALGVPSIFVVNSRALVVQQSEYLRRHLHNFSVANTPQAEVFVATGEVIRIALETGQLIAERLRCVIFDEAHHAVGRHPYAEVLRLLREGCCPARILGLTASFLHGNSDPERRLEVLEDRFRAQAFSPQVHPTLSHSERRFMEVPWFESAQDRDGTLAAYASYASHLDVLVENLKELKDPSGQFNWELQNSLEREKGRLRGVLESLGPAAYQPFVQESLLEVVQAKLSSKLAFADGDSVECLQRALVLLPRCREVLASRVSTVSDEASGKFEALCKLLRRLLSGSTDKILVFVERVSVAGPMPRLLEASTGVEIAHVCGVQGMEEGLRLKNLQRFRSTCRVLVATASLEEGLDVPDCRYVVRYDFFSSAKSHVQGAGRARHGEAEIFYFDNDPKSEEERRRRVEDALLGQSRAGRAERETEQEPQEPQPQEPPSLPSQSEAQLELELEGGGSGSTPGGPGLGHGHAWGEEQTLWDYRQKKSFRGMTCACGALLHITSRAYGRGRKKKERIFSVQGALVCPIPAARDKNGSVRAEEDDREGLVASATHRLSQSTLPKFSPGRCCLKPTLGPFCHGPFCNV
eukprot:s4407_g5.t1